MKKKFNFQKNFRISRNYKVVSPLGHGIEGEVYRVKEIDTGVERAAKLFYMSKEQSRRAMRGYAKKLHRLKGCNSLIKYIGRETLKIDNETYDILLSDYVQGYTLDTYLNSWYDGYLEAYQALHLFYSVVKSVEEIHLCGEWHGDIHSENIIIQKSGLYYDLKLIDVFVDKGPRLERIQQDVYQLCDLLYELIGGVQAYKDQPRIIKAICCGLKKTLIKKKFKSATDIRVFIENMDWSEGVSP